MQNQLTCHTRNCNFNLIAWPTFYCPWKKVKSELKWQMLNCIWTCVDYILGKYKSELLQNIIVIKYSHKV